VATQIPNIPVVAVVVVVVVVVSSSSSSWTYSRGSRALVFVREIKLEDLRLPEGHSKKKKKKTVTKKAILAKSDRPTSLPFFFSFFF
jgi:hypothetical protein